MIRQSSFFRIITMAAVLGCLANQAVAERLYVRMARGNNVGLGVMDDWGMPLYTSSSMGVHFQFPKGSGNFITNNVWTIAVGTTRDIDGDGTVEDTMVLGSGGRDQMPYNASIWREEQLRELSTGPQNMETAASSRSGTNINQVWSSLDPENLTTWPLEAREGYTETGDPVLHGAETIYTGSGDVFNSWGGPTNGFFMGWSFYFLDFAENNNIAYGHVIMQQVTHYMKWAPTYGLSGTSPNNDITVQNPDGFTWAGMVLFHNQRDFRFGGVRAAWAYHPEKEIIAHFAGEPTVSSFTPPEPPVLGFKMLKKPKFKGQEAQLTNVHFADPGSFGGPETSNLLAMGLTRGQSYRVALNEEPLYAGVLSPYNGKPLTGWPGVLSPEDDRYDQWLWGGNSWSSFTMYGELNDMGPRDTTSFDFAIMMTPANGKTIVRPERDIANIDDPGMQEAFADQELYADLAMTTLEEGFQGPATPQAPPLTIIPGDRQVSITWSDINVKTPDPFYYYLEEKGWNPDGNYREYDFEGYRLYRNFFAPGNEHAELLADFNVSSGTVQFHYVDRLEEDDPYFRMRNGMKVWYALVPYDRNYNADSGEMFSLPDITSGKQWNKSGEKLYNVVPRSDASNFRAASWDGNITFAPVSSGTPVMDDSPTIAIPGNGDGTLAQAPAYRAPITDFQFEVANDEKITTQKKLTITAVMDSWKPTIHAWGFVYGKMKFQLSENGTATEPSTEFPYRRYTGRPGNVSVVLSSPVDGDGAAYAVAADFMYLSDGHFRNELLKNFDTGGYTGASVGIYGTHSRTERKPGYPPGILSMMRTGRFTLTWSSGGAGLTLAVKDVTRGVDLPFAEFPEDYGWGFVTLDNFGGEWSGRGQMYEDMLGDVPKSQRTMKMVSSLSADNTEEFGLMVNGLFWRFSGTDGVLAGMPSSGTVMTIDNAYGRWNSDKTVFNQKREPPFPGDKWELTIEPSTLKAEDADLSKIKVVPNPYLATSYLDLSPMSRRIEFTNLPDRCTIRIYTLGGNLVNVLNHIGANRQGWGNYTDWDRLVESVPKELTGWDNHSGTEPWNLQNRFGQTVASGLYFFHVTDSRGETFTGKFYVVL